MTIQRPTLCDAHVHLFEGGFIMPSGERPAGCDELGAYEALRAEHAIDSALVIGYEGDSVYRSNNAYLLARAAERPWIRPVVFAGMSATATDVERAIANGAYGVSVYATNATEEAHLSRLLRRVAAPLVEHRALLSLNVVPALYRSVGELCERLPEQRVLLSHLGLPAAGSRTVDDILAALHSLSSLADAPNVFVKASAFYALAGLIAPHEALASVISAFGPNRVMWGSDFSPVLARHSFIEAIDLVHSVDLPHASKVAIMGGTLARLLDEVER